MKTKRLITIALVIFSFVTFNSCMKENDMMSGSGDPLSLMQLSADENAVDDIMIDAINDIGALLSASNTGLKSMAWKPCNGTVDSTAKVNDTITFYITYKGPSCNGKNERAGKIEVRKKAGTKWDQKGATVIYKYINLSVTRKSTNKSVVLNGTKTFVNVNGGLRSQVGDKISSYVEKISGTMQASIDNGPNRSWNVARQITYTGKQGQLILAVDGFGTANNLQNLVVWGTNIQGEQFYTRITQSIVHKETCNMDPVSGIKIHQIPSDNKSVTLTFGYKADNKPVSGDECPTHYKLDWQKNNLSGTKYLPL